ncbi:MAG: glycosyltransferase family 2 protein [Candidatus Woesearchaeota archaeon]|jgi:glycosyltransferase involved in cell wall biosynthesis|nr:glycosyltransferase family 2 protein [Candidatus Woesearchaeota archaeon]MDP7622775.1 glycosyltransferase family 2 protein [Candidatus Woesearchaeota archaeon]HJN56451.1 glycosyltransferase family 2 protein [Candidatus Woesearchaeota archaeon]|tara:strand:+ start:52739 stop:53464 length:726 start_codon:yes stop_codon:yes gene_type:complete
MSKPDITMFFPAYNEEENIQKLLTSAVKVLRQSANNYEILVIVYAGSTDKTIAVVKKFKKKNRRIKLLIQPKDKKGIGYAKIMGFKNARYSYIFYADSDNQFDLKEFKKFLPYIGKYDIIAGYRIKRHDPKARIIISKIYNIMMRTLFGTKECDLDCAFRLVNKKVINSISLKCRTGVATTEILAKARKKGFKIKEVGINHYPRKLGQPIFESKFLNLPKPKVVINIIKDILLLYGDLNEK